MWRSNWTVSSQAVPWDRHSWWLPLHDVDFSSAAQSQNQANDDQYRAEEKPDEPCGTCHQRAGNSRASYGGRLTTGPARRQHVVANAAR